MSSHVFVVDSRARKARVATTPGTYLSDVMQQGCQKLGLDPASFVLKHNNKLLDLSRPMRQAGLTGGAQLELVQGSRSPTVITVALQIPHLDSSRRVTDKFPSSHSIWQILRAVETEEHLNFTQRAVARIADANSSSGRLCYEMPVVNAANRELNSFADLQKTLAQIGITSGNVLMRLTFKETKQPMEDAMRDISEFFKEAVVKNPGAGIEVEYFKPQLESTEPSSTETADIIVPDAPNASKEPQISIEKNMLDEEKMDTESPASPSATPSITVYHAPTTDASSRVVHNEADYVPTVEHASIHQSRLKQYSQNKRLPSDAEIAAKEQEQEAKLAAVNHVDVRVRFPDGTFIQADFSRGSTAQDLYNVVGSQLQKPNNKFGLRYTDPQGRHIILVNDPKLDLISKAKWASRQLVNMEWDPSVSADARTGPALASEVLKQAQKLPVPAEPKNSDESEEKKGFLGKLMKKDGDKSNMSSGDKEDKLKKLLGFGKKR